MKKGKNLSVNTVKLNDFLRDYKAYCANEEAIAIDYGNAQRDILNGFLFRDCGKEYLRAWQILIAALPEEYFTDEVLDFLIKNKTELVTLAHFRFSDEWLLKIYNADSHCDEALFTVGKRRLSAGSKENFKQFIDDYVSESLYGFLLKQAEVIGTYNDEIVGKLRTLVSAVKMNFSETSLGVLAKQIESYLRLLFVEDISEVEKAFTEGFPLNLLAVSQNPVCPNDILIYLSTISGIKYARRIRENSRKRLLALKLSTVKQEEITFNEE